MARSTRSWARAVVVAVLATRALSQKCYYPNGNEADPVEKPCSTEPGSACCPGTWECLDNGLCRNPAENFYGRYSCSDKTWKSPGCPSNMCTSGGTAFGGESITQCSNHENQWCCNADNIHVNCCQESPSPRPFFRLQDGVAYATIGKNQASSQPTLASITMLASGSDSGGGNSASRTPAPSSQANSQSNAQSNAQSAAPPSAQVSTSRLTSVSSGPGGVQTIVQTQLVTPASNPTGIPAGSNSSSGNSSSGPNIGLIVGCAVGIPLALALLGIVFWMLRKRRQQKTNPYGDKKNSVGSAESPGSSAFAGGAAAGLGKKGVYRHSRPGTTEIDGAPAGPGRPVSNIPGHAELDSGHGFQPGHNAYGPDTVGIGGGAGDGRSTWGSAPPGYSPGANQTAFQHANPGASELDGTSVMPAINEKPEAPQQYQAYRPPATELPTVKTPPEDVEKQMPR